MGSGEIFGYESQVIVVRNHIFMLKSGEVTIFEFI